MEYAVEWSMYARSPLHTEEPYITSRESIPDMITWSDGTSWHPVEYLDTSDCNYVGIIFRRYQLKPEHQRQDD